MTASRSRHLVDPELGPLLQLWPTISINAETLPAMRARSLPLPIDPVAVEQTEKEERVVPGPAGAPEAPIIIYRPKGMTGALPCILHIHGGGYVGGSAEPLEGAHRPLVAALSCVLVTVNYRLAPETRFPGAIEDCYAVLGWMVANAEALGIDPARIGVMGESAGGGLAAALALLARDRGDYRLAFQHLIYPMIDDRTVVAADPHPYTGEYVWTAESNAFGWASLLGVPPGSDGVSPYAAAARAETLKGLPPTFISTGALDLFLEEDLEYARRLTREGVPVELHVYPGAYHAFNIAAGAGVAQAAQRDSLTALRRALHPASGV